jgi:carbonic anhydrase
MNQTRCRTAVKLHGTSHRLLPVIALSCVLSLLLLSGCGQAEQHEAETAQTAEAETHQAADGEVHWGYKGNTGPDHWAELSSDFTMCTESARQSPINLTGAKPVTGPPLSRLGNRGLIGQEQRARALDLIDNGHTIQVIADFPIAVDLDEKHYELVQFHFHAPSEHTIDGEHAPLEIHFVNKSAGGHLVVLAALINEGDFNPVWEPIIADLPASLDETRHLENVDLDVSVLPKATGPYYRYSGSLTTPPCSEGVEWIVMAETWSISTEQMAAMTARLHDNNRPVQPLGNRELTLVSEN